MKKYETVLEATFQFVEKGCRQEELDDLKRAVEILIKFRKAAEPVFILRGQDKAAAKTVYAWGVFAEREGAPPEMTRYASKKSREIEEWQEANPKMTKIPD